MASKWYPGFCEKYGIVRVHAAVPMALYAAKAYFNDAARATIEAEAFRGLGVSLIGMMGAAAASMALNALVLPNRGIGKSRGGRIVRACQAAVYAGPVAAGLVFNGLMATGPDSGTLDPGVPAASEAPVSVTTPAIPPARP